MDKIQLMVLGLSASPASNNAYALIMKEVDGDRRMPIIIGAFEAQAIALEMEGVIPPRPMTHDLLKAILDTSGMNLSEVVINELIEGTFFAKLIFDTHGAEIDCRPSDAIALAIRCQAPVYVSNDILEATAVFQQGESDSKEGDTGYPKKQTGDTKPKSRLEMLQLELDRAITDEDYEKAARVRDEIKHLLDSQ